jgi:hypothetical protein
LSRDDNRRGGAPRAANVGQDRLRVPLQLIVVKVDCDPILFRLEDNSSEDGVDVIADLPNSAVALAVIQVAREKRKIAFTGAGSSDITGPILLA